MALDLTIIRTRQRAAADHFGDTLTYAATSYRCFPVSMRDTELRNRGQTFRESYMESVSVFRADVTIAVGAKVTRNSVTMRVLDKSASPDGLQDVLHLGKEFE
jgi:hypothetical protein